MSNHHEPQEGLRRHKLLPQDVKRKLPRLYAQDGKGDQAIVHLKLFSPYLGQTIYITEGQEDGPEVEFFGWHSADRELQYMYLSNFAEARRGRLPLYERDCYFPKGKTLREWTATFDNPLLVWYHQLMSNHVTKTEHSGAKKGNGAYWGRKADAKRQSNKARRQNDKAATR